MNTAPKLLDITHDEMQALDRAGADCRRTGDYMLMATLHEKLCAMRSAALAPPSGEGVDAVLIRQAVARGWCAPENMRKVMDVHLAHAIVREVLAVIATPPPASQERGGEWKAGDRVLWQSSNGTEFPGTIVRRNLVTYDCKLDDGCDAEGFVAARFKPLAASPPSSAADDSYGVAPPFDHTKHPVVRPDSFGVAGAAEPAKPAAIKTDDPKSCAECGGAGWTKDYEGNEIKCSTCAARKAKPAIKTDDPLQQIYTSEQDKSVAINPHEIDSKLIGEQAQARELPELIDALIQAAADDMDNGREEYGPRTKEIRAMLISRLAGGVTVDDAMVERACKRYAFREDGAEWPDAYSEHEVAAERVLMREFLVHVLGAGRG